MCSLSPAPPPPSPLLPLNQHASTPSRAQVSLTQITARQKVFGAPAREQNSGNLGMEKLRSGLILPPPRPRRTSLLVWCSAIICLLLSVILIFFGIATLIIFLAIKPRYPSMDIFAANLNSIYFDSPEYFNGDLSLLANFSNPNEKLDVRFEYLDLGLYFSDRFVAAQALQPFTLKQGERRLESIRLISSLVYMPQKLGVQLQKEVQSNKVSYYVIGTFKVSASLGTIHFSYWLHGRCRLDLSSPPTGVLVGRYCKMKR